LIDASECLRLDLQTRLLVDLPAEAVFDRLTVFENSAGRFPVAVVSALDDEGPALVVDDDAGDADGVAVVLGHGFLSRHRYLDRRLHHNRCGSTPIAGPNSSTVALTLVPELSSAGDVLRRPVSAFG
jgi:hypothetical protein